VYLVGSMSFLYLFISSFLRFLGFLSSVLSVITLFIFFLDLFPDFLLFPSFFLAWFTLRRFGCDRRH
jgi:uncharacterized membrane protein YbhN (UPF0104 family)